jgi:chemotaxis protein MotB
MAFDGTPIIIKRVKAHGHAHHGGSWKVAYADFVTAMMAFFLTLWIMGLSDSTRTQVAGYFNDPMGFSKTPPSSKNIIKMPNLDSPKPGESKASGDQQASGASTVGHALTKIERANPKLSNLIKNTQVTYDATGIHIAFIETKNTVFFKLGSAELTPEAREYIDSLEPTLAKFGKEMSFEGHTDARQYSGYYNNFDLSTDRARSLMHALQEDGVPGKQVAGLSGMGDRQLAFPNDPFDARNRRVSIWIHTTHPEEAKKALGDLGIRKSLRDDLTPDRPDIAPKAPSIGKGDSAKS